MAFAKINEVVANINEYQRQAEGLQRILDLQKLVDGIDVRRNIRIEFFNRYSDVFCFFFAFVDFSRTWKIFTKRSRSEFLEEL